MNIPGWKPLNYLELHPVEHFFQSKKRHNVFFGKNFRVVVFFSNVIGHQQRQHQQQQQQKRHCETVQPNFWISSSNSELLLNFYSTSYFFIQLKYIITTNGLVLLELEESANLIALNTIQ